MGDKQISEPQVGKVTLFKLWVDNVNSSQTIGGFIVITPKFNYFFSCLYPKSKLAIYQHFSILHNSFGIFFL